MSRHRDYILDISPHLLVHQQADDTEVAENQSDNSLRGRPWLAVHWRCCQVYNRIYRTADGKFYKGNCPKCGNHVQARVGEGGTHSRFFEAG